MFRTTLFAIFAGAGFLSVNGTAHAQYYVPHSSTHIDYVPHSETHFDHVPHGNHYDLVPLTTTHLDAIPHTTSHFDAIPYSSRRVPLAADINLFIR